MSAIEPVFRQGASELPAEGFARIARPALVPAFVEEAGALLEKVEAAIPGLEGPGSADVLRSLLRPLHTLKGAAGLLGLAPMSGLAHDLESYLNFHGPGSEALCAVEQAATVFRELLTDLEMANPVAPQVSDDLLARCQDLRAMLVIQSSPGRVSPEDPVPGSGERQLAGTIAATRDRATAGTPQPASHPIRPAAPPRDSSELLRVEAGKLDRLLERLDEWDEAHAALAEAARTGVLTSSSLYRDLSRFYDLGREVRAAGLAIRLTSFQRSFQKVEWLVHDLAPRLDKQVDLELHGATVELDISAAKELDTMLLHLARNALEHGLETPDERRRLGKDPRGILRLSAQSFEEALVVEVTDDGRGFDRDRILAEAKARKLVDPAVQASDPELLKLLFTPGFSTARAVTETAGRGLGLDIVRRAVEKLGGVLEINSDAGRGTTFQLYLSYGAGGNREGDDNQPWESVLRRVLPAEEEGEAVSDRSDC